MQLITFRFQNHVRVGVRVDDWIVDLAQTCPEFTTDMIELLRLGESGLQMVRQAVDGCAEKDRIRESEIEYLAPIPRPGKILCVGHNYVGHIGIGKTELPEIPNLFCKTVNTIIGHRQAIVIPRMTEQVDYEAELAVVVGKPGRYIPVEDAMRHVAGYSIFNDVSARDVQKRTSQWFTGKSFDTFGPLGPALVTTDEIPDPHCLDLELRVNGLLKQKTNTSDFIFNVPYLVSYLSQVLMLETGDVIATGTPAKLPEAANPQVFLRAGDEVAINISGLGKLVNPVVESQVAVRDSER